MKEQYRQFDNNFAQNGQRERLIEQFKKDTRIYDGSDYEKIYAPAKEYWGINSPAFIIPKRLFDSISHSEVKPQKIEGDFAIILNRDCSSNPDFLKYLIEHEYSELYIYQKEGFNLRELSNADNAVPLLDRSRPAHRYATFKEFQLAEKDNNLDEYMQWWRDYYRRDMENIKNMDQSDIDKLSKNYRAESDARSSIIKLIENNLKIKEEIYKKISAKRNDSGVLQKAA